jgi:hypothetical protein
MRSRRSNFKMARGSDAASHDFLTLNNSLSIPKFRCRPQLSWSYSQ